MRMRHQPLGRPGPRPNSLADDANAPQRSGHPRTLKALPPARRPRSADAIRLRLSNSVRVILAIDNIDLLRVVSHIETAFRITVTSRVIAVNVRPKRVGV